MGRPHHPERSPRIGRRLQGDLFVLVDTCTLGHAHPHLAWWCAPQIGLEIILEQTLYKGTFLPLFTIVPFFMLSQIWFDDALSWKHPKMSLKNKALYDFGLIFLVLFTLACMNTSTQLRATVFVLCDVVWWKVAEVKQGREGRPSFVASCVCVGDHASAINHHSSSIIINQLPGIINHSGFIIHSSKLRAYVRVLFPYTKSTNNRAKIN